MMKIQVKLASCCQPFLFDFGGMTVSYSHESNNEEVISWINEGDIRVLDYPFALPDNPFTAHKELTEYLKSLGEYDIGAFFDLPISSPDGGERTE